MGQAKALEPTRSLDRCHVVGGAPGRPSLRRPNGARRARTRERQDDDCPSRGKAGGKQTAAYFESSQSTVVAPWTVTLFSAPLSFGCQTFTAYEPSASPAIVYEPSAAVTAKYGVGRAAT